MNPNHSHNTVYWGRYRFLFLGFLFPVFHYLIMLLVQALATVVMSLTFSMGQNITVTEVEEKTLFYLTAYADVFSLISAFLTAILAVLVYRIIVSKLERRQMPSPSLKTYFSLQRIPRSLVFKLLLLAFFFYHFVLGFLNLIDKLAPSLMESYRDAAQSVNAGNSAFSLIMSFLALVVAAPITEELIYRNMAISNMRSRLPAVLSVFLSSLIFGVFHGNLVWMLYAGGIGILFGFLYVKSESVYVSLAVHIGFNLIGYLYSVMGNFMPDSAMSTVNTISFALILVSIIGAPLVFLWVWLDLSQKAD